MSILVAKELVAVLEVRPQLSPELAEADHPPPAVLAVERPIALLQAVVQQGVAGPSGGASFEFTQSTPAAEWIYNHNLGRRPQVTVLSPGGLEVDAHVVHVSVNQVRVYFDSPYAGFLQIVG